MRKALFWLVLTVCLGLLAASVASAQGYANYSRDELDELMAPIALYPDPLLAQILPAATYPDQIDEAHERLGGRVDGRFIDRENWDVSVKAVAHYPDVLDMMYDDQDWTVAIGQAYAEQPDDVFGAIQRLRLRAYRVGTLTTTPEQRVVVAEEGTILIVPAQTQRIYVPRYHPQQVYVESRDRDSDVLVAFGVGLLIGAWLDRDMDWHRHRVYYHGWHGGGWIAACRPHITLLPVYVNPRWHRDYVPLNRRIIDHPIRPFRDRIRRDAEINRPVYASGRRPTTGRFATPGYGVRVRSSRSAPVLHRTVPSPRPVISGSDRARGRRLDMPVQARARGRSVSLPDTSSRVRRYDGHQTRVRVRTSEQRPIDRPRIETRRVGPTHESGRTQFGAVSPRVERSQSRIATPRAERSQSHIVSPRVERRQTHVVSPRVERSQTRIATPRAERTTKEVPRASSRGRGNADHAKSKGRDQGNSKRGKGREDGDQGGR